MFYNKKTLQKTDVADKTVIVRLDLNVPMKDNKVTDFERIDGALPTLKYLLDKNCKVVVLSHLGRIKTLEDKTSGKKSLGPVAKVLQERLPENKVIFSKDNVGANVVQAVNNLKNKEILVLENTRYNDVDDQGAVVKKESKNDPELGRFWASLGKVFVNDAFGTVHRKHASNVGIASNIKDSCVGLLIEKELTNLQKVTTNQKRPFVVLLGGAKVSDKLGVVTKLLEIADHVLIGGGMVNTFLKAKGVDIGKSTFEADLVDTAKGLLEKDTKHKIVLAVDQRIAPEFADVKSRNHSVDEPLGEFGDWMGLDVGPKTVKLFESYLENAKTIFWNGPLGVFEFENYAKSTNEIAKYIAKVTAKGAFSVMGGGDIVAAVNKIGIGHEMSFVSTGGGASLNLVEGSPLPGIDAIPDAK
ncbi:phosphoglycerate kinase [[Mycoplasma] testudinis]|uniref:phosphoglycerate kinase n=1 Tax=[Mycoplasma] testudinis TaxID=33924 RepID=UPI00056B49F0|nr:phosphoglycerate kinase [[Mycoplasma] testudinis]